MEGLVYPANEHGFGLWSSEDTKGIRRGMLWSPLCFGKIPPMTALNMDAKESKGQVGGFHNQLGKRGYPPELIEGGHLTSC